jgi:hypothetical protein
MAIDLLPEIPTWHIKISLISRALSPNLRFSKL